MTVLFLLAKQNFLKKQRNKIQCDNLFFLDQIPSHTLQSTWQDAVVR